MRQKMSIVVWVLLIGGLASLVVFSGWPQQLVGSFAYAVESGQASAAKHLLKDNTNWTTAFEMAAQAIKPSVVCIYSTRTVASPNTNFTVPPQFRRFFGNFFNQGPQQTWHQNALGSGVIVSKDGHILTNNHVVAGADELTVQLSDNRQFKAKVVGTDPKTDLAVIKINAHDLLPATLAFDDPVRVGQWVLAVGSPFGLKQTVTAGIISATGRGNVGLADYDDFLQTDAAINPGNSGGPLINLRGQVVGINTAIASNSGGYQGIGFAIPAALAHNVMEQLITTGKVTRGYLGVTIQELTPALGRSFGYTKSHGILISDVLAQGPAATAGLKDGDIIMSMDGHTVGDLGTFRNDVAQTAPGTKVKLGIWRAGKAQEVTVTLGQLPSHLALVGGNARVGSLGLTLGDLTPSLAQRFHLGAASTGALVVGVTPGSAAEMAGLEPGDLIVEVQGKAVAGAADAQAALSKANLKEGVRLRVRHGQMTRYVFLQVQR